MTEQYVKSMFEKMTLVDKATWLNLLIKEKYSATMLEGNIDIKIISCNCNYEQNYMILDHFIWKLYGIHYKEYVSFLGFGCPSFDPIKFERACEKRILSYFPVN